MRINAANDVLSSAWPRYNPPTVQIRVGVLRMTATPDEADTFAKQLIDAANAAREPR